MTLNAFQLLDMYALTMDQRTLMQMKLGKKGDKNNIL